MSIASAQADIAKDIMKFVLEKRRENKLSSIVDGHIRNFLYVFPDSLHKRVQDYLQSRTPGNKRLNSIETTRASPLGHVYEQMVATNASIDKDFLTFYWLYVHTRCLGEFNYFGIVIQCHQHRMPSCPRHEPKGSWLVFDREDVWSFCKI